MSADDPNANDRLQSEGEFAKPEWSFKYVEPGPIEAGEALLPAKIDSPLGRQFASLHLIQGDLTAARYCFAKAEQIGPPDSSNIDSWALIFSGVVGYARIFKSGVKALRLGPEYFDGVPGFISDCHSYLIALRDKHIAHSVNEFERCDAVAVLVGSIGAGQPRYGGAIGTIKQQSVGLNRVMLRAAITHFNAMIAFLESKIEAMRADLHVEFKTQFEADGSWQMVPIFTAPNRQQVARPRPSKGGGANR